MKPPLLTMPLLYSSASRPPLLSLLLLVLVLLVLHLLSLWLRFDDTNPNVTV